VKRDVRIVASAEMGRSVGGPAPSGRPSAAPAPRIARLADQAPALGLGHQVVTVLAADGEKALWVAQHFRLLRRFFRDGSIFRFGRSRHIGTDDVFMTARDT
jgi:hypothetical protein